MQFVTPQSKLFDLAAKSVLEDARTYGLDKSFLKKHLKCAVHGRYSKEEDLICLLNYLIIYNVKGWSIATAGKSTVCIEFVFVYPEHDYQNWFEMMTKQLSHKNNLRLVTKEEKVVRAAHASGFKLQGVEDKKLRFERVLSGN